MHLPELYLRRSILGASFRCSSWFLRGGLFRALAVFWVPLASRTDDYSRHLKMGQVHKSGSREHIAETRPWRWKPAIYGVGASWPVWGTGMTPKVLWEVVRGAATRAGIEKLAPHDLRRSCARLCHLAGGELDQIQFLLGHVSIQTTERYLGCKQKLRIAVNDRMGIEPDNAPASQ